MSVLALDIGGARLKAADGLGWACSRYFPLWQRPGDLPDALRDLIAEAERASPVRRLVATMTGELADCFTTKADGVEAIVAALVQAASGREVRIYLTDGTQVPPGEAVARPLEAAAANWHALARFAGRYLPQGVALLIDIGSTTCDIIPLCDGQPAASGRTDPERLATGELVYTGIERSPICGVIATLPWQGREVPVAHELFSTTWDAYLLLGDVPEEAGSRHTADGRPATRRAAHDRLARSICADRTMFTFDDALAAAAAVAEAQLATRAAAARRVVHRLSALPEAVVLSGQGEFLGRKLLDRMQLSSRIVSLAAELGSDVSRAATAHALAVLAGSGASDSQCSMLQGGRWSPDVP